MNEQLPAIPDDLPMSLVDVAETLGLRVAIKLMQIYGGQEVKFPRRPGSDHAVTKALGEADAIAVCNLLGGDLIYIPHGRARRSARADILALEAKGHDRREIARILGLSQRHVRRAVNVPDPRQPDLFDE